MTDNKCTPPDTKRQSLNGRCGIYRITGPDGRYVGASTNLGKRKQQHFWFLRHGCHTAPRFQEAFDKYGEDAFEFAVVTFCQPYELYREERAEIAKGASYNSEEIARAHREAGWATRMPEKTRLALERYKARQAVQP